MYCPIYKGQCSYDCVFHLGIGEECLIINALQAFIKDKHKTNQKQAKSNEYMEYLNSLYDMCLSTVHSSKEDDVYNISLCGKDRIAELQRSAQAHTPRDYQDAIQENDESFIIPI